MFVEIALIYSADFTWVTHIQNKNPSACTRMCVVIITRHSECQSLSKYVREYYMDTFRAYHIDAIKPNAHARFLAVGWITCFSFLTDSIFMLSHKQVFRFRKLLNLLI